MTNVFWRWFCYPLTCWTDCLVKFAQRVQKTLSSYFDLTSCLSQSIHALVFRLLLLRSAYHEVCSYSSGTIQLACFFRADRILWLLSQYYFRSTNEAVATASRSDSPVVHMAVGFLAKSLEYFFGRIKGYNVFLNEISFYQFFCKKYFHHMNVTLVPKSAEMKNGLLV